MGGCICSQNQTKNSEIKTGKIEEPSLNKEIVLYKTGIEPGNNSDTITNSKENFHSQSHEPLYHSDLNDGVNKLESIEVRNNDKSNDKNEINIISTSKLSIPIKDIIKDDENNELKMSNNAISYSNSFIKNQSERDNIENILIKEKEIKLKKKKKKNFSEEILELINNFREAPKSFIPKLNEFNEFIVEKNGKSILNKKGYPKIVLNNGKLAISNTVKILNELEPMSRLEYNKLLEIPISDNPDDWTSYNKILDDKTNELLSNKSVKYNMFCFHFDLSITDPEFSLLMQLLDDTGFNGFRRNHFCDPELNYIAITSKLINLNETGNISKNTTGNLEKDKKQKDKKFCSYFCFAK
jgi:hypothetical protein